MPDQLLLGVALRYLNYRPRSEVEVRTRLAKVSTDQAAIEDIIQTLLKLGLLNDKRMGQSVVDSMLSRAKGPLAVRQKTRQLGLETPEIDDSQWQEAAALAVDKLAKKYQDKPLLDQKRLVMAGLARRGFSRQQAWRAIDDWLKDR